MAGPRQATTAAVLLVLFVAIMALACLLRIMAVAPLLVQFGDAQSGYGSVPLSATVPGATSFVAPSGYPTGVFSSYYPVPSGQEPQPALFDPVLNFTCKAGEILVYRCERRADRGGSAEQLDQPGYDSRL